MNREISHRTLFITADDRTGSLEIGGIVASVDNAISVGPHADDPICCVVDLASRHIASTAAFDRVLLTHQRRASYRCHKMDAGLRGNWPHEIHALVELGYKVAVVPSFPDAGRRCKDGIVYIQDVPVLDSPFGADPLTAPCSSKPVEVLEDANCVFNEVEVWDANDNVELDRATRRCLDEERVLVGPTGAIGSYATHLFGVRERVQIQLLLPILVICGSLNATSRNQIERVPGKRIGLGESISSSDDVTIFATPIPDGEITKSMAQAKAQEVADFVRQIQQPVPAWVIVGGDTVAAVVGEATLRVLGTAAPGIPVSLYQNKMLITKGGGIGVEDSLLEIANNARRIN